jgi:hypothetical protein
MEDSIAGFYSVRGPLGVVVEGESLGKESPSGES